MNATTTAKKKPRKVTDRTAKRQGKRTPDEPLISLALQASAAWGAVNPADGGSEPTWPGWPSSPRPVGQRVQLPTPPAMGPAPEDVWAKLEADTDAQGRQAGVEDGVQADPPVEGEMDDVAETPESPEEPAGLPLDLDEDSGCDFMVAEPSDAPAIDENEGESAPAQGRSSGSPPEREEPPRIEGQPTVRLCLLAADKLSRCGEELTLEQRRHLMDSALGHLLFAIKVEDGIVSRLAADLQQADPHTYGAWVGARLRQGLAFATSTAFRPNKHGRNLTAIIRPQLIEDLGLTEASQLLALDAALAGFVQYLQLTLELRLYEYSGHTRPLQVAATQARLHSSALAALKLYLDRMDKLRAESHERRAKQRRCPSMSASRTGRSDGEIDSGTSQGPAVLEEYAKASAADASDRAAPEESC